MPRYAYECDKCGNTFYKVVSVDDRHDVNCECGCRAIKLLSVEAKLEIFKPMMYTDICETPIWVESKNQLKEECRKHDVIACRLM